MKRFLFCLFFIFGPGIAMLNSHAQSLSHDSIKIIMDRCLHYLESKQIKETQEGQHYSGEWPVSMEMERGFFLLGLKKKVPDSNCFSVAGTHNLLARIYLSDTGRTEIPAMLSGSMRAILRYRNGERFNFWHLLPPFRKLYARDTLYPHTFVRRPTHFRLKSRYINKAAHVVEDADDTALAYTALELYGRVCKGKESVLLAEKPMRIAGLFDAYRDTGRSNFHWYNFINHYQRNSGAYLTWHASEYSFNQWSIFKTTFHNATFYLPFSECYPFAYKPYMPYGSNDMDAVVNANILSCLKLNGELHALGYASGVQLLKRMIRLKKYDRVATYYPNRYQFPFAFAMAFYSGVEELGEFRGDLSQDLLARQAADGSWSSRRWINRHDRIQSTAYAVNALLLLNNKPDRSIMQAIERGFHYLMTKAHQEKQEMWWDGGVLFSGGTVVRLSLFWKSDAYTTALVAHALELYRRQVLKEEKP